jgi:hypothetical protein
MAEIKTKPTEVSVTDFIAKAESEQVRDDCRTLVKLMKKVTGSAPKMWGPTIIGFGQYHYKYKSGHEGDMCLTGFSPRKGNLTLYVMDEFAQRDALLKKLGKFKASKACLYVKKLADIDLDVLEKIVKGSVDYVKKKYPDKK